MVKLIVHAGFPKCGSTSVFSALKANLDTLVAHDILVFNRNFNLPADPGKLMPPLWELQDALKEPAKSEAMRDSIIRNIAKSPANARLILSSENLSQPPMAKMLAGMERHCEVELIFYFRPQTEWIPSAWKQWNLKEGFTLSETIESYVANHRPDYLGSVKAWTEALPGIKVTPRPFLRSWMTNGNPAYDFFDMLGIDVEPSETFEERSNPSIDYALMYLMQRNSSRIFENRHDNRGLHAMTARLPAAYQKTNVQMVSPAQADFIADHFQDDNMELLQHYMGMGYDQARAFSRQHFRKTVTGTAYSDIPEAELLDRAAGILREVTGKDGDPDTLLLEMMSPPP